MTWNDGKLENDNERKNEKCMTNEECIVRARTQTNHFPKKMTFENAVLCLVFCLEMNWLKNTKSFENNYHKSLVMARQK